MKKSELKQLIKEVIQEMEIDFDKYNVTDDGKFEEIDGKNYAYFAKVSHEDDGSVHVDEIIIMDEDGNELTDLDQKIVDKLESAARSKYRHYYRDEIYADADKRSWKQKMRDDKDRTYFL
jgi:hypothetical protein